MSYSSAIEIYLKQVGKCLFCPPKIRKDILSKIKNEAEVAFETGSLSENSIAEVFGTPEEIAKNYLLDVDTEMLLSEYKKMRRRRILFTVLCAILVLCIGIAIGAILQDAGLSTSFVDTQQGFIY